MWSWGAKIICEFSSDWMDFFFTHPRNVSFLHFATKCFHFVTNLISFLECEMVILFCCKDCSWVDPNHTSIVVRFFWSLVVSLKKLTICIVGYMRQINISGAISEIKVSAKKQDQLTRLDSLPAFILPWAKWCIQYVPYKALSLLAMG